MSGQEYPLGYDTIFVPTGKIEDGVIETEQVLDKGQFINYVENSNLVKLNEHHWVA
jgi:hypothetical protein